jgi:hypothetical protein
MSKMDRWIKKIKPRSATTPANPVCSCAAEKARRTEAPAASQFRILGGARSGWLIDFFARGQLFTSVQIEGFGGIAQIGADGGTLFQRDRSPDGVTRLSYRFTLGAGVQPGSYQWPLAMSLRAQ